MMKLVQELSEDEEEIISTKKERWKRWKRWKG